MSSRNQVLFSTIYSLALFRSLVGLRLAARGSQSSVLNFFFVCLFLFFFYMQRKENGFLWLSLKIKDIFSQNYPGNLLCLIGPWRFRLLTIPQPAIEKEGVELPLLP